MPKPQKKSDDLTIVIPRDFLGQLIDELEIVIEQWQGTADYLGSGYNPEGIIIRECSNVREAEKQVAYYEQIKDYLESQMYGSKTR